MRQTAQKTGTLGQSDVSPVKRLLLKHPRDAFESEAAIDRQWRKLNYLGRPDFSRAMDEYDRWVELLEGFDIELHFLPGRKDVGLDSLYTRDASIVCNKGIILCNMGKVERRNEPSAQEAAFRALGVPIRGAVTGSGRVEGGDVAWLDEHTPAIARGYRTNDEGIRQVRELMGDCIDEMIIVPLPHWRGPNDVFHLMSFLSPIDTDLALVYSPLLPVPFRETLLSRSITLVEVPDSEFDTLGCNVLAVAPRRCIMPAGNPRTRARLEKAEVEVSEFEGKEISIKGGGGPTCLSRPFLRG
ncbi:MAG: arginine deiminase family protein [Desulfatiglandaceae bacterium]